MPDNSLITIDKRKIDNGIKSLKSDIQKPVQ